MTGEEVLIHKETFSRFLSSSEISQAVSTMADQINHDYRGKKIVVIGVLDGAFMVLADLLRHLNVSLSLELIKLKSYSGQRSSGQVQELIGLTSSLKDKYVVIVEDIIDTGRTLQYLLKLLEEQKPATIRVATLLLKKDIFQNKFPIEYIGIPIPDKFVVGYGMDYDGLGRELKDIYALKD